LVNTAKGRIKQRNVSTDPRVAVSVIDSSNPYHMVTVRGKVIGQINGKDAEEHIDKYQVTFVPYPSNPVAGSNSTTLNFSVLENSTNISNVYSAH
jgi:hypothetical protein